MKTKTIVSAALMSAFLFMGQTCGTGTQISGPAVIAAVQGFCGIVIPIADIAALVSANPALTSVDAVANAICSAFKAQQAKAPTAAQSGHVIVDGVLVHYAVKT